MKPGRRRVERRRGVHVVLGGRDEALLRSLARFRIARTSDLLALFFPRVRRDTAMARLRRLLDSGFVDVQVPGLTADNVYSLGSAGQAFADRHGLPHDPPPQGNPEHHLAVVRVWTRLAATLHGRPDLHLAGFVPDWDLRRRLTGTAPPVVADAWVQIQPGGSNRATHAFSLEVDLGTERAGELERKLTAYQPTDGGQGGLVVVLVGAGVQRRRVVSGLLERSWPGWGVVCGMEEWPEALLHRLGGPLADSHGGQGSASSASPSGASQSCSSGVRPSRQDEGDRSER